MVNNDVMLHLFGVINKYELRKRLGPSHKAIWEEVISNGYLLKNCKLYLWAYTQSKKRGLTVSPLAYGVSKEDAAQLRKIDLSSVPDFKAYRLESYNALELSLFGASNLDIYIRKFVIRKLRFLVSYGVYTVDCMCSQLMAAALLAFRKQFPRFDSELHALNACKQAIHNAGMGLIEHHTRDKRNVLKRNADNTFTSSISSMDAVGDTLSVDERDAHYARISVEQLAKRMKPKARVYFNALRGIYEPAFSEFLGDKEPTTLDGMRKKARQFYGVTPAQEQRLFDKLKECL